MDYINSGMMFPGSSKMYFPMTSKGISSTSAIQEMMKKSHDSFDMHVIKKTFEEFLGFTISDCNAQAKEQSKEELNNVSEVKNDFQQALAASKKMTTPEFFNAKLDAQRNGILKTIANCEARLADYAVSAEEKMLLTVKLENYRKDLQLWDSLHPDEQLFFVIKSMADFEKNNQSYYRDSANVYGQWKTSRTSYASAGATEIEMMK